MKQIISYTIDTPLSVQRFIQTWKRLKHYPQTNYLTIGELLELLAATTTNLHKDDSDGRFWNRILTNDESMLGWEGEELIDILYYEAIKAIKKKLARV